MICRIEQVLKKKTFKHVCFSSKTWRTQKGFEYVCKNLEKNTFKYEMSYDFLCLEMTVSPNYSFPLTQYEKAPSIHEK